MTKKEWQVTLLIAAAVLALVVYAIATVRKWVPKLSRSTREALARALGMPPETAATATNTLLNEFISSEIQHRAGKIGAWASIVAVVFAAAKAWPLTLRLAGAGAGAVGIGGLAGGTALAMIFGFALVKFLHWTGGLDALKDLVGAGGDVGCSPGVMAGAWDPVALRICGTYAT